MTKEEFCELWCLNDDQFFGRSEIPWMIDARTLKVLPEGISLNIIEGEREAYLNLKSLEELPEGCSLSCSGNILLNKLKVLPKGCNIESVEDLFLESLEVLGEDCNISAYYIDLRSLKELSEEYLIDANVVCCDIILPTFKGSKVFFYGGSTKKFFGDYLYIKENPSKYSSSEIPLERALAEYFLKESL